METDEKQIGEIVSASRKPQEAERLNELKIEKILEIQLLISGEDEEREGKEIELPEVRFVKDCEGEGDNPEPYGPDRARVWKKTGEWLKEIVIDEHPDISERTYQNRLKAEKSYFYGEDEPDYYEWQEDEETLSRIRKNYVRVKQDLIDRIDHPTRADFDRLYPHKYDDPGLSERGRRTVRDLKAVFGSNVVVDGN